SANKASHCSLVRCMMITLAVDNGRQGKVDQLGLECVVGVTLTVNECHSEFFHGCWRCPPHALHGFLTQITEQLSLFLCLHPLFLFLG
ncbi:hypothetical protein, partial [Shewanella baltica]|uniref:hypothetical protein n=1 Tax=Shewanella baltica TaxID=62322 RepID=UPI003D7A5F33